MRMHRGTYSDNKIEHDLARAFKLAHFCCSLFSTSVRPSVSSFGSFAFWFFFRFTTPTYIRCFGNELVAHRLHAQRCRCERTSSTGWSCTKQRRHWRHGCVASAEAGCVYMLPGRPEAPMHCFWVHGRCAKQRTGGLRLQPFECCHSGLSLGCCCCCRFHGPLPKMTPVLCNVCCAIQVLKHWWFHSK